MKPEQPSKDIVVFRLISNKENSCSECHKELGKGNLLRVENGNGLCMVCADLDHLVTLPQGDAAMTRRAKKYSKLWAVIMRFSRTRGRYERQGLLVEKEAFDKAEEELLSASELAAQRKLHAEMNLTDEDQKLARDILPKLLQMFPHCPPTDAKEIARQGSEYIYTLVKRNEAGGPNEEDIRALLTRYARHHYTTYDEFLIQGMSRASAKAAVSQQLQEVLERWSQQ